MILNFIMRLFSSRWNNQVFDSILICVDAYIKMMHYFPCHKIINMSELIILLINNIITWYKMLKNLISNCASLFISKFWLILCYYLKAKCRLSIIFHSQIDEQTEHQNQMLKHYLHCYCSFEQDDWVSHLSMTEFIYNNVKHSSTGMLSFEALYIYSSDLCLNIKNNILKRETPAAWEWVKEMYKIQKLLEKNLTKIIK